jgi:hypothetical protein
MSVAREKKIVSLAKTQRTPRKAQMDKENKMLGTQELWPFLAIFAA